MTRLQRAVQTRAAQDVQNCVPFTQYPSRSKREQQYKPAAARAAGAAEDNSNSIREGWTTKLETSEPGDVVRTEQLTLDTLIRSRLVE